MFLHMERKFKGALFLSQKPHLSFRTLIKASKMTFETQALPLEGTFQMERDTSIIM